MRGVRRVLVLCLVLLACGERRPQEGPAAEPVRPAPAPRRGMWVLSEGSQRVLEHPERIDGLIADAGALGVTDLFVQVYRGGRAWFESELADATPYRELRAATGEDTLAHLIQAAHAAGLRVHAWVNVMSLAGNRNAPVLEALPDAVAVDRQGRSLLDYPKLDVPPPDRRYYRMGTPAVWLDPGAPGLDERLAATFAELLVRHPDLDGLQLDYIRYPDVLPFSPGSRFGVGLDFGYGAATRKRFREETGLMAPFRDSLANANRWDAWRRDQVTNAVRLIGAAAHAVAPKLELSAAVWTWTDRAYLSLGQDWRRWLEDDLLGFVVAMAYTPDDRLLRYQAEHFAGLYGGRVWVGLGSWLFAGEPARAVRQVEIVRQAGVAADSLFSWDAIADAPALRAALAGEGGAGGP
jgi:uncharacterized lipoprotein YddW (UPF0748 family)